MQDRLDDRLDVENPAPDLTNLPLKKHQRPHRSGGLGFLMLVAIGLIGLIGVGHLAQQAVIERQSQPSGARQP